MSIDQLRIIQNTVKHLLSQNSKDSTNFDGWLLNAIETDLKMRGLSSTIPPFNHFKASQYFENFQNHTQSIRTIYQNTLKRLQTQIEHQQFALLLIQSLSHYLTHCCQPSKDTDFWGLIQSINSIPRAIERSFPNYSKNNLLYLIVKVHITTLHDSPLYPTL